MPNPDVPAHLRAAITAGLGDASAPWRHMATDGRHRMWLVETQPHPIVVKGYLPEIDLYYAHRWRREERALDLLHRYAPGLAPEPLAAAHAPGQWAALAMQHVGHRSLADGLPAPSNSEGTQALDAALDAYRRFQSITEKFGPMLRALAYQSDLDRITRRTLERRYASAFVRLPDPTASPSPTAAPRRTAPNAPWDLVDTLIKPLLSSPRRIVHNGFSPLNLIWNDDRLVVIDWETLAVAPPEIDFADLLTFPGWGPPDRMAERSTAVIADHGLRLDTFWAAAAERSLTYAATAHVRSHRLRITNPTLADAYQQRLPRYLDWFQLAATELLPHFTDRDRLHATVAALRPNA
ncbi:MAG: aminoglycoside phosphotransferase family protein [Chloroflexota bacterium]|nr:aminoglycoside phosphotransferase family protein [Chloroflexota bacterium]MDE2919780.1 aminoglycoside phosphotransferase family protein [Chloroflexota bacterium]